MRLRSVALRNVGAAAVLVSGAAPTLGAPAEASTPPALWYGVAGLNIHCLVTGRTGVDDAFGRRLCARVRDLAAAGAPIPVGAIGPGDPALLAPDRVTLLVQGSVQPSPAGDLIAFAVRPFRNSQEQVLFAAAPRAVLVADAPALDAALSAALSETLPWLAEPAGPRPLNR